MNKTMEAIDVCIKAMQVIDTARNKDQLEVARQYIILAKPYMTADTFYLYAYLWGKWTCRMYPLRNDG